MVRLMNKSVIRRPKPYKLWGHDVDLVINKYVFPSYEEIENNDKKLFNPIHGYFQTEIAMNNYFTGLPNSPKLHYRKYVPDPKVYPTPRAIVVFQHGIGGHSGSCVKLSEDDYTNMGLLARALTAQGYALYALDMLGHGFSEGIRFYIPNKGKWQINRDHLSEFCLFAASEFDDEVPFFLMGESYGACLAIHVARRWQSHPHLGPKSFKGICLLAPAIIGDLPPPWVVWILKNIFAKPFPKWVPFFMPSPVTPERIWKIEKVRREQSKGRDVIMGFSHGGSPFRLGTAVGLLDAMKKVRGEDVIGTLNVPFAVAHGTDDVALPMAGTDYLLDFAKTNEENRAVRKVEGALHDLLGDPTKDETVKFMIDFINRRIEM